VIARNKPVTLLVRVAAGDRVALKAIVSEVKQHVYTARSGRVRRKATNCHIHFGSSQGFERLGFALIERRCFPFILVRSNSAFSGLPIWRTKHPPGISRFHLHANRLEL
jgi:hypothetical protein